MTMAHARQNQVPNRRMQPTAASVASDSLGAFRASAAADAGAFPASKETDHVHALVLAREAR